MSTPSAVGASRAVLAVGMAVILLGCPARRVTTTWGGSDEIRAWAKTPRVVEYVRENVAEDVSLPDKLMRAEWLGPVVIDDRMIYDVVTEDIGRDSPVVVERVRHSYGPEGFAYLGTLDEDGHLERWDPPQVVLPPRPRVGDVWEATHVKGERQSVRSCEIITSELCEGGIVSVCDSQLPEGRIVLRDHFCPGIGWSGFEALVLREGNPTVRMWSSRVVVDGRALPDPTPSDPE